MIKNKKIFLCLILLLISITLLFVLSAKTNSISSQVETLKEQVKQ